jgi:hypothetical protein
MTPVERADFLAWLMRLDLSQLREVNSHVNSVMTHKRGAKLRLLGPGSQIVFHVGKVYGEPVKQVIGERAVGTIVKMFKTSVEVESARGERCRVEVDAILGLHVGGMEFAPLESAQPLGFPQVPGGLPPESHETVVTGAEEERFEPPMDWTPPTE